MKAICFHCHFVAVGLDQAACPQCGYPLIKSAGPRRLATSQINEAFEMADVRPAAPALPGVIHRELRRPRGILPEPPARTAAPVPAPEAATGIEPVRVGSRLALVGEILSGILLAGLVIMILGIWSG
jgi:hypothetical protein